MSIETYVMAVDPNAATKISIDENTQFLDLLGSDEDAIAIQLQELFTSVTDAISGSITVESTLTVEVTGSITIKAEGGLKFLFFNVGAEAGSTGTMKVTLSTTLQPKSSD